MQDPERNKFRRHLKKQIDFLERSCASYDMGYHDEAIRIATVLRVLIHNTSRSTSLLQHLNATNIEVLTTCPDIHTLIPGPPGDILDPSKFRVTFRGLGSMRLGGGKAELLPSNQKGFQEYIPVDKWWDQIVWVLDTGHTLTRKSITLTAADKDGGAHVDAKLTPEYESLAKDGAAGVYYRRVCDKEERHPITDAHLASLRQMAYEVLNSPRLTELCN